MCYENCKNLIYTIKHAIKIKNITYITIHDLFIFRPTNSENSC